LIADEVLSGFGRTGRWFAVDHDHVTPDLMTMAKGLTSGYAPGGAVIVSERIARHFDDHVLQCGLTTYAHPLTCAAIVAAIESYRDEGLIARAATLGAWLSPRLFELARTRPFIGDVRGIGLLWALELVVPGTREPLGSDAMARVAAGLRQRHVHLHRRDNMVFVAPPLVATEDDLTLALTALGEALDEARA
jgi:taurine--2-oxoglutarate transaminase